MVASVEMVNCEPEYSTLTEATKAARSHSTQDAGVSPHAAKEEWMYIAMYQKCKRELLN